MECIVAEAVVKCGHEGRITNVPTQHWVRVARVGETASTDSARLLLIQDDPLGRTVVACPNYGPVIKPCTTTVRVGVGYSSWIRIDGRSIVLSSLDGLTDGTPPGAVHFSVRDPQQVFVRADR